MLQRTIGLCCLLAVVVTFAFSAPFVSVEKTYPTGLMKSGPVIFHSTTRLVYQVPASSFIELKIFDSTGKEIATLVNGIQDAGRKSVLWNAGSEIPGMYWYRLTTISLADPFTRDQEFKKFVLAK